MFQFTYAISELRRRIGRTIVTALGLAAGVSLVAGIIGVSQGLRDAQEEVLAPLQAVGTDILVTRVVGAASTDTSGDTTSTVQGPPAGQNRGFFGGPGRGEQLNTQDQQELLNENSSVVTDLSKLGKPGERFTHDFFLSATLLSFPQAAIDEIAKIDGVTSAVGGLTQLASHQTGTVPEITAEIQTGGQTIEQEVTQEPLTAAEQEQIRKCLEANGAFPTAPATDQVEEGVVPGPQVRIRGNNEAFDKCMPERFKKLRASFTTPLETIRQAIDPPATDTTSTSYTASGVDPAHPKQGLVTTEQLAEGEWLKADKPREVLVNTAYANKNDLKIGSVIPINGSDYTVVGLVNPTFSGDTADIYFTLSELQTLAGKQERVTQVLVKADSADEVDRVVEEIRKALPGAQVVTTKDLTEQVTGSLADAKKLTDRLGVALAVIVLVGAFIIAMLLTLSSVSKRVREIGTLRAIGWSKARVVRQILIETVGIGVLGGLLGIAFGYAVCLAISALSPTFSATVTGMAGLSGSRYSELFGRSAEVATKTAQVTLDVPLHPSTVALALGFAIVGGLLAGLVGGWRAARLAPAVALRNVG